jgi:hypothetical protein
MSVTLPWKASRDTPVNGVADKVDEVRKNLSKEAERLSEMAADYTRQATAHVSEVASDTANIVTNTARDARDQASGAASEHAGNASSWLNDLLRAAAALGTAIAFGGRKTAQDLGDNAQSVAKDLGKNAGAVAKDLRNVRITTEPRRTGPDFAPGITLLAGFGAGIALMYFMDPERGRARRNMLRDKLTSWTRQATEMANATARDMSNRMQGGSQSSVMDVDPTSDTQTWRPTDVEGGEYTSPEIDGSTTDTWGTQPQRETSSL